MGKDSGFWKINNVLQKGGEKVGEVQMWVINLETCSNI